MTTAMSDGIASKRLDSSSRNSSRSSSTLPACPACADSWRAENDGELLSTQATGGL